MALGQRYYHELHFFCAECGDPFLEPSKSSAAGTEVLRSGAEPEEDQTKEFVIHGKYAFCEECHVKLHKPKCKGCRKPIRDVAVAALGSKWHKECFRCSVSAPRRGPRSVATDRLHCDSNATDPSRTTTFSP